MPKTSWEKIDEIIHKCKNALQKAWAIELKARKLKNSKTSQEIKKNAIDLRKIIGEELEKLNEIVLEQVNGGNNE